MNIIIHDLLLLSIIHYSSITMEALSNKCIHSYYSSLITSTGAYCILQGTATRECQCAEWTNSTLSPKGSSANLTSLHIVKWELTRVGGGKPWGDKNSIHTPGRKEPGQVPEQNRRVQFITTELFKANTHFPWSQCFTCSETYPLTFYGVLVCLLLVAHTTCEPQEEDDLCGSYGGK